MLGGKFRLGEALIFGLAGYVSGRALQGSGVMSGLYTASHNGGGKWSGFVDGVYQANGGSSNPNNPGANGGVAAVIKGLGFGVGAYAVQDAARNGLKAKHVSVLLPLAIGMGLDDIPNARGGYAATTSGTTSAGPRW